MNKQDKEATREFLRNKMYEMLPDLDKVTSGNHPIWDRNFSNVMAEVLLQLIEVGNIVEDITKASL